MGETAGQRPASVLIRTGETNRLTDDHMDPLDLPEKRLLSNDVLEGGDNDLEVALLDPDRRVSTSLRSSFEDDRRDRGGPLNSIESK